MCSYNRVNGTHACEDDHTLNQILKGGKAINKLINITIYIYLFIYFC